MPAWSLILSWTLENELQTQAEKLPKLWAEEGRFLVIPGDELLGTFAAYENALGTGYDAAASQPLLVRRFSAMETPIHRFTRPLRLCHT